MQNRYAGDSGDFSKLGLLRVLHDAGLTVGLNWYLRPDESHNDDGCHTDYVNQDRFAGCDDDLRRRLKALVEAGERSVKALTDEGILQAVHYTDMLDFSGKTKEERRIMRTLWHQKALEQLSETDIVCTDPDNGLIVPSACGTPRENKYILPEEIRDYYLRGKSVIYYQHKARKPDEYYTEQHRKILEDSVYREASGFLLKFRTTSQRCYCFIVQPEHRARIESAVQRMLETAWNRHFIRM